MREVELTIDQIVDLIWALKEAENDRFPKDDLVNKWRILIEKLQREL